MLNKKQNWRNDIELFSICFVLQKETNFDLRDLLRMDFQRVHNELLLHLGTNYSQVYST